MNRDNYTRRARVRSRFVISALVCAGLAATVAACGGDDNASAGSGEGLSGTIRIDGSSTVGPLTEIAAELFREENPDVRVTVGISGTGGGFEKFCASETDVSDASRSIEPEEKDACEKGGVRYEEVQVANDGLAVVVNPDNDWASCLTVEQLNKIWAPDSTVKSWKDVDPSFPDEPLTLFGPGTDSGTFDYFTGEINGEEGASRTDYQPSEDDNVIVQGVSGSKGAMGYFGLSYAQENEGTVQPIEVDGGSGCVAPTAETVLDGTYTPLGRPLFIYISKAALEREEVKAFVDFYIENDDAIAEQALFIPLSEEQAAEAKSKVESLAGS